MVSLTSTECCSQINNDTKKYDHIIPVLYYLYWLPVFYRIIIVATSLRREVATMSSSCKSRKSSNLRIVFVTRSWVEFTTKSWRDLSRLYS